MEYLECTQERDASVTTEYVKAEVLFKVLVTMPEKYPALRVTKADANYYSLHRNLRLDFINGKPKKAVDQFVSVIEPATLKTLIESKLEMDMSELKKEFLEFVAYLEKMAIIHGEHCHVVEHEKICDSGLKNTSEISDAGSRRPGHNSGGSSYGGASNKVTVTERSPDITGRWTRMVLESISSTRRRCAGEKHYFPDCPHTG
jgi:hypothetical protein